MHARFARLAVMAAAGALMIGAPVAHAAEGDEQFLAALADLGIVFESPEEAVAAGNNVCDIVAEGSANAVTPVEIRSAIVNSMVGEGLSEAEAGQVMISAVAAYCPQYTTVTG